MHTFDTNAEAREFVRDRVDIPVADSVESLGNGMVMQAHSLGLHESSFTNVYDLSFPAGSAQPSICFQDVLTSVFDYASANSDVRAAIGGGFFFLADEASAVPRQLGLNLAIADGQLRGFPVVDREAVISNGQRMTVAHVQALGALEINGAELSWSGSLTDYETDVKVYANANSVITHVQSDATGNVRVLDESSRFTPPIEFNDTVDIGYVRRDDGVFVGVSRSSGGELDIFSHDVVIRTHERHVERGFPHMRVRTIGDYPLDGPLKGAVSAGPMIDTEDFTNHEINQDRSLGSRPPFLDVPLARTALFETDDGIVHLRLFDGRPGSQIFPGVTPTQAAQNVKAEDVVWGCFLDPGQTAKLVVRNEDDLASYGNTHYLQWPKRPEEKFIWTPKTGRSVASMITLR